MASYWVSEDTASWRVVEDEAVIIHVQTSEYFSLNQAGTWLWTRLAEKPQGEDELARQLGTRYQRPADEVRSDVAAFLEQLNQAQLLSNGAGPSAPLNPPADNLSANPRDAYEPPQLVKFGDLETLILSGE